MRGWLALACVALPWCGGVRMPGGAFRGRGDARRFVIGPSLPFDALPLDLTLENVNKVFDEMRPYLVADGGNVTVLSIEDDGRVLVQLEGSCASCPASLVTVKMGLEKRLHERIPTAKAVEAISMTSDFSKDGVQEILLGLSDFLKLTKSSIEVIECGGITGVGHTVSMRFSGPSATNQTIRREVQQRLRRRFPLLNSVTWQE